MHTTVNYFSRRVGPARVLKALQALIIGFLLTTQVISTASAQESCRTLFEAQSRSVEKVVGSDAYQQWLKWEQTANLPRFRQSDEPIQVPMSFVSRFKVDLQVSPDLPNEVRDRLIQGEQVLWPSHPYNTEEKVPFQNLAVAGSLPAYLTASRSLVFASPELRGFSMKLPTDHPHGPDRAAQPGKANTVDDVVVALLHSDHIKGRDAELGPDERLILLNEVMTIADKKSGIGVIIRDVRALDDGNYYVPALSIPWIGRKIAKANGVPFDIFWGEHYAKALGDAKARLLLRYGIQMETPNAQNMLIQLDRQLKPTGKIVFRDVSDAFFVEPVAKAFGFDAQLAKDENASYPAQKTIKPFWSNSSWRFDEAGRQSVASDTLAKWETLHNDAFVEKLNQELRLKLKTFSGSEARDIYRKFTTFEGQLALHAFAERTQRKAQAAGF